MLRIDPKEKAYVRFKEMFVTDSRFQWNYYRTTISLGYDLLELSDKNDIIKNIQKKLDKIIAMCNPTFKNLYEIEYWLSTTIYRNEYFLGRNALKITEEYLRGELDNVVISLNVEINKIVPNIRFTSQALGRI